MTTNFESLGNLEAIFMDPEIHRIIKLIESYNELLEVQPVTNAELVEIINEIDEEWVHLLGDEAVFTGVAAFLRENDNSENAAPTEEYYENQNVTFRGVIARQLEQSPVTGATVIEEDTDFYQLRVGLVREGIDNSLNVLTMHGSAAIENIATLEFNQFMSTKRARYWLEYYCPELIDDIDESVINSETANEASLVTELSGCEWNLGQTEISPDIDVLARIKGAFQVYIRELFDFDSAVGYGIHIDGQAWLEREGNFIAIGLTAAAIATNLSLQLDTDPSEDNELIVKPHLQMTLHDDDKDETPIKVLVPVDSIQGISSIRSNFYSSVFEPNTLEV